MKRVFGLYSVLNIIMKPHALFQTVETIVRAVRKLEYLLCVKNCARLQLPICMTAICNALEMSKK